MHEENYVATRSVLLPLLRFCDECADTTSIAELNETIDPFGSLARQHDG